MNPALNELARELGYTFSNPDLLHKAVTHRSASSHNNERLEFLGDAILGFVVAELLYEKFPTAQEGQLSRLRASLVNRDALAQIARALNLGEYLHLGSGELKSGGFRRESILADAVEAVFGAILLDSDTAHCRECIHRLLADKLAGLSISDQLKDPKTRLQEYLQSRGLGLPGYEVTEVAGRSHNQHFTVECRVDSVQRMSSGEGSSRRRAEQSAAGKMLTDLSVKE